MYNNNSNSGEWAVIPNQLLCNKLSDLAMTKTPMDTIKSVKSESDLQNPNSTKSELLKEIPWPKMQLPEPCLKKLTPDDLLPKGENSHSDLEKPIKSDELNYDGLSYLGVFLLQRKLNCVDEDMYPGLAEVDEFILKNKSLPKIKDLVTHVSILSTCPVEDENQLFDLNLFPPSRLQSYRRVNCKDKDVICLAKTALYDFNKSANNRLPYKFIKVVKAVAHQLTHYITFRSKDHAGNKNIFQTEVGAYYPKVEVFYVRENSKMTIQAYPLPLLDNQIVMKSSRGVFFVWKKIK